MLVDLPCHLIQVVRLVHALSETGLPMVVRRNDWDKFSLLRSRLGMSVHPGERGDFLLSSFVEYSHEAPFTQVDTIRRLLIFPHIIGEWCRSRWGGERIHRYAFAGLLTPGREVSLQKWADQQFGENRLVFRRGRENRRSIVEAITRWSKCRKSENSKVVSVPPGRNALVFKSRTRVPGQSLG